MAKHRCSLNGERLCVAITAPLAPMVNCKGYLHSVLQHLPYLPGSRIWSGSNQSCSGVFGRPPGDLRGSTLVNRQKKVFSRSSFTHPRSSPAFIHDSVPPHVSWAWKHILQHSCHTGRVHLATLAHRLTDISSTDLSKLPGIHIL